MTFTSGISGNPTGRPKGTGSRQQLFNSLVEPHKEELFETALNLALGGNEAMLRLFLDRMLPTKPADDPVALSLSDSNGTKTDALLHLGGSILKAMSQSELTPQQAKTLMSTLDMQRKQIETSELADRVKVIEQVLKQRK
jgi:hypothetical protein